MPIFCLKTDCLHEMRGECFADGAATADDWCPSYQPYDYDPKTEARAYRADMARKGDE